MVEFSFEQYTRQLLWASSSSTGKSGKLIGRDLSGWLW